MKHNYVFEQSVDGLCCFSLMQVVLVLVPFNALDLLCVCCVKSRLNMVDLKNHISHCIGGKSLRISHSKQTKIGGFYNKQKK